MASSKYVLVSKLINWVKAASASGKPLEPYLERAAKLPLLDAAYNLWLVRYERNREEGLMSPPAGKDWNVGSAVLHDRRVAPLPGSPTFSRLRRAHPNASDEELRLSIATAVAFDTACVTNFSYGDRFGPDVRVAIDAARKEYPSYLEETYSLAHDELMRAMR
jgi:hypothetical protein